MSSINPSGRDWPGTPNFALFGVGHRRKLLYTEGVLSDALSGEMLERFEVSSAAYRPEAYRVDLNTPHGPVSLFEDESGVWLERGGQREALGEAGEPVKLPSFEGHPRADMLRVLHHELLVNVVGGAPLPNLFVYAKPWFRDAAMVALAFERTGNAGLLRAWVADLRDPFDRNNAGHEEPDNLGQVLTLIALTGFDATHPAVAGVLLAAESQSRDGHLEGLSDFAPHPVYQTKWLKYGLKRLGLDDPYTIPSVFDPYSALFWMGFLDQHVPGSLFDDSLATPDPYLKWAEAHFLRAAPGGADRPAPPLGLAGRSFPLSWEAEASQADYAGLGRLSQPLILERRASPHTWHAAEMFLLLLDDAGDH